MFKINGKCIWNCIVQWDACKCISAFKTYLVAQTLGKKVWLVISKLFCNLILPQVTSTDCKTICFVAIVIAIALPMDI